MTAFAPRPILRSAGTHIYRQGETPWGIAQLYGQPASSYRDLVAANHRKPLSMRGVPSGASATFQSLHDGERLRLPWFWFAGKNDGARRMLAGGNVGDVQQDAISSALTALFAPAAKTPELVARVPVLVNMLGLFWRQDHPGQAAPSSFTIDDLKPYLPFVNAWIDVIGKNIPSSKAAEIPWNEVPFRALAIFQSASGITLSAINWGVINDYLEKNVTVGLFPMATTPIDFKQAQDFTGNVPNTNGKWINLPWNVLGQVRWDLLPLSYLATDAAPGDLGQQTNWLLHKIQFAVAKQKAAQSGSSPPSGEQAPFPSATPPDCSKLGKPAYAEKNAAGLYTGICITCGANAHIAADGLCDCNPGFQLDPTNPNNPDCVPVSSGNMCPNGGVFTVGQGGAVGCKCPDGSMTVTGPSGGCKAPPAPAAASDDSNTPLLIAGGVLLGGLALYFANRKKLP